jgi:hypothetical protein
MTKTPSSQGCIERGNAPFKEALSRWMEENATEDWTTGSYIVKEKINERVIQVRGNQAPLELMFGEGPKFDNAVE